VAPQEVTPAIAYHRGVKAAGTMAWVPELSTAPEGQLARNRLWLFRRSGWRIEDLDIVASESVLP
jgi:hypothetical protein